MQIRPGAAAVILTDEGVLLQRRSDNGRWGLPGGGVEPGESVSAAVVREVLEETGLDVEPVRLVGVYSDPANHQVVTYPDGNVIHYVSTVFECRIVGGTLTCGDESLELAFFDPEALPAEVLPIARIRIQDALERRVEAFVR
jgi:ADP-ribose pyrophosphatase YjhB (NUDIX family)